MASFKISDTNKSRIFCSFTYEVREKEGDPKKLPHKVRKSIQKLAAVKR